MKNEFKFLYSNYLLHVDMIECITNQGYRVIESNNKGILISDKDNIVVMLSAIDINSGKMDKKIYRVAGQNATWDLRKLK